LPTAFITHPECNDHDTGQDHPETARRLSAINDQLVVSGLSDVLRHVDAPVVTEEQLLRVHAREYLDTIKSMIPDIGYARLDPDTVISPKSLGAASRAAGAVVKAVDLVIAENYNSAFCAVRPPGHHAE
jgi:acetoin utilization deacetylase AcuC-like enzyme